MIQAFLNYNFITWLQSCHRLAPCPFHLAVIRGDADAALDSVSGHENCCTRRKSIIKQAVEEMAQERDAGGIGGIGGAVRKVLEWGDVGVCCRAA